MRTCRLMVKIPYLAFFLLPVMKNIKICLNNLDYIFASYNNLYLYRHVWVDACKYASAWGLIKLRHRKDPPFSPLTPKHLSKHQSTLFQLLCYNV